MDGAQMRERLTQLNTKAYYLLVALSFIYRPNPALSYKTALTLTAIVAVLPVQDYFHPERAHSDRALSVIRWVKVILLTAAFFCTLWWLWCASQQS
jgi:hypothetical protein